MKTNEDFKELDQQTTNNVLDEFKDKITTEMCGYCYGKGCVECNNVGSIEIQR